MEVKLIKSNRGKDMLCVNYYSYFRQKVLNCGETFWRCSKKDCKSKVFTVGPEHLVTRHEGLHTHEADTEKLNRQIISNSCKRKAEEEIGERPSKIIRQELQNTLPETVTEKDVEYIRKNIYNHRRKFLPGRTPRSAEEVHSVLETFEIKTSKDFLRNTATSTQSLSNDGFEPVLDLGNENYSKRKRNEEVEIPLSDYALPTPSQTSTIGRAPVQTATYISYKQKYTELLDLYNSLKQEVQQLKKNIIMTEKFTDTFNLTPSVEQTQEDYLQIRHSQEEIEELGKCWTQEFSRLRPDQQIFAKKAIEKVFSAAKINNLHSNSVSVETDETKIEIKDENNYHDEHLYSINEELGDDSVKTEHTGIEIYDDNNDNDDPVTLINYDFGDAIVKREETKIEVFDRDNDLDSMSEDFDTIGVITEEIDDREQINLDDVAVRVKAEETEIYDCNSDNSANLCLLKIKKDNVDINMTSEEIEICEHRKDNVLDFDIKVEKNDDF